MPWTIAEPAQRTNSISIEKSIRNAIGAIKNALGGQNRIGGILVIKYIING